MLKELESLKKSQLDPDFVTISDEFVETVTREVKYKTIKEIPITGRGNVIYDTFLYKFPLQIIISGTV